MLGGAERTLAQWQVLLQATGFRMGALTRTRCPFSVLAATPI